MSYCLVMYLRSNARAQCGIWSPWSVKKEFRGRKVGEPPKERLCVDKCLIGIGVFVDLFRNWCP